MGDANQPSQTQLDDLWAHHHGEWRDPTQVVAHWQLAEKDTEAMRGRVQGHWWETLDQLDITLIISREYEHFVLSMTVVDGQPCISYISLPHPSGITFDESTNSLYIAATRNPNQIIQFKPLSETMPRTDMPYQGELTGQLMPVKSQFYAGSLYMHDLAMIDGVLHANSVGQNAIVRFGEDGSAEIVWYPRSIEKDGAPQIDKNYLQLNSIAAGTSLETSFFSASAEKPSSRRPGHQNFPVDGRGVIFAGATREVLVRGLTRPHSARLHQSKIYVDNSGYGTVGMVEDGQYEPIIKLPGWTRGLGIYDNIAFVGTSRVIPKFSQYAPGLDVETSVCGIHALDLSSGKVLGSLIWEYGNQIFAIECLPRTLTTGFPFNANRQRYHQQEKQLFYTYKTEK